MFQDEISSAPSNRNATSAVVGMSAGPMATCSQMGNVRSQIMMQRVECRVYDTGMGVRSSLSQPPRISSKMVISCCIWNFCACEMSACSTMSDITCMHSSGCTTPHPVSYLILRYECCAKVSDTQHTVRCLQDRRQPCYTIYTMNLTVQINVVSGSSQLRYAGQCYKSATWHAAAHPMSSRHHQV